ncbi:MAG: Crp/Fnr family transcriptional regulator [Proteobacteria bacterium]|nr:Crp/Fnr family transcriptional regulator [Pseudomonadota bacterium]
MPTTPVRPPDRAELIARLALFQELTRAQLEDIVHASRPVTLGRGALLFQKGDRPAGFFVVVSGQVKLAFPSLHGAEKVVEILGPGQTFGEALMFMERPYPVFAEAVTEAMLLEIPRQPVNDLLSRDPAFARAMLAGLAKRLHGLIQDVEDYSTRSGTERLIGYLLRQADDAAEGPVEVMLPSAKSLIASRLNLTPETLSRVLHDLAARGLVEVRGKQVRILDLQRLADVGRDRERED